MSGLTLGMFMLVSVPTLNILSGFAFGIVLIISSGIAFVFTSGTTSVDVWARVRGRMYARFNEVQR